MDTLCPDRSGIIYVFSRKIKILHGIGGPAGNVGVHIHQIEITAVRGGREYIEYTAV